MVRTSVVMVQLPPLRERGTDIQLLARHYLNRACSEYGLPIKILAARPLIVVLEDLHWMDQATGEFLAMMTESLISDRILLCATHRSGYALPLAQGAFGTQLTLSRVSRRDTGAIGCSLLGASALSVELQQLLDDKTDGNPFFVEEVLRSLQEGGLLERQGDEVGLVRPIGKIDIPDSIQDVPLGAQDQYDSVYRYWKNPSCSQWMRFRYSIRMFAGMGGLALARGDLAAARMHSAECLALTTRTGSRKNLVKVLILRLIRSRSARRAPLRPRTPKTNCLRRKEKGGHF